MMYDPDHLNKALDAHGGHMSRLKSYFWHWRLSMAEACFLFIMMIGSVIHAFFPFLLSFKLLELRIERLRLLKQSLPNDKLLQKVKFDD